jgi:glycogen phosphorylase
LEKFADDSGFLQRWRNIQETAKVSLANYIKATMKIEVDPKSMFDTQVKRIHEYKRQHLNALHILSLYCQLKSGTLQNIPARTFLFGGKAAPSYTMAKLMIKLVCSVADVVNADLQTRDLLNVVLYPITMSRWANGSIRRRICRSRSRLLARKPRVLGVRRCR